MATIQSQVLGYLSQEADRVIPIDEVSEQLSLTEQQVSSAITALIQGGNFPQVERPRRSMVRWNSGVQSGTLRKGEAILVEVLRDDTDKRLVADEDGNVWVMSRLEY